MPPLPYRIEIPSLVLACPSPEHAPLRLRAIEENFERLQDFYRLEAKPTLEDQVAVIRRGRSQHDQDLDACYSVLTPDEKAMVGEIFLMRRAGHDAREIGYTLFEPFAGRGLGTEAARAAVFASFRVLDLKRMDLAYSPSNPKSARVAAKLGFLREGHLRARTISSDPRPSDTVMCSLLREDFEIRARVWPAPRCFDILGREIALEPRA